MEVTDNYYDITKLTMFTVMTEKVACKTVTNYL